MSAAAANPSTFSEVRPRGTDKRGERPFFLSRNLNEPQPKPLRAVRSAGALWSRHRSARNTLSRAAARGASGPFCRGARRRTARVDAAGDARERGLSDLEVAFAARCLHAAIARRGSGARDEHGDASRIPHGTDKLARTHRSPVRRTGSPASIASRLARRERENL